MSDAGADESLPRVVVVTGPTAAGKSALAIELALALGGEIVNADSMQVYRGMDVGTAKPSPEDRARVAHHLLDVVTPDVQYSAGRYARDAAPVVADIHARGRRVFLCGGTGLYIRALLHGLAAGLGADRAVRETLESEHERAVAEGDPERLHRRLAKVDVESARRLHPHDLRRIVRALEIHAVTRRPATELLRETAPRGPRYRVLHLAIDPGQTALAHRIDRRCERMMEGGLLQEVRRLRQEGYGPELPSMQAIGYRHMQPVIEGVETLANVLVAMKADTRRFARRQRTWLRQVREAVWMHPDDAGAIRAVVERFLETGQTPGTRPATAGGEGACARGGG